MLPVSLESSVLLYFQCVSHSAFSISSVSYFCLYSDASVFLSIVTGGNLRGLYIRRALILIFIYQNA